MPASRRSQPRTLVLALGLCLAGLGSSATVPGDEPTVFRKLALGAPFPALALRTLEGAESSWQPAAGEAQLVAFLRLDQEDSRQLFAELLSLAADRQGPQPRVVVVGLHDGAWTSRAKGLPRRVSIRLADGPSLGAELGLIVLPSVALVDAQGRLSRAYVLYDADLLARIRADLAALTGGGEQAQDADLLVRQRFDALDRNAAALEGIGRHDAALALRRQQLALGLSQGRVLADMGRLHFLAGRAEQAVDELRRSLESESTVSATTWLGRALARAGRVDEALPILEDVLGLTPQKAIVHRELAEILKQQGHVSAALEHIKAAITLARVRPGGGAP